MISWAAFFRRAQNSEGFSGTKDIQPRAGLCGRYSGGSTPVIRLPDARTLWVDLMQVIWNNGGATFAVHDNAGGVIGTVAAGTPAVLYLFDTSTQAGGWRLVTKTFL